MRLQPIMVERIASANRKGDIARSYIACQRDRTGLEWHKYGGTFVGRKLHGFLHRRCIGTVEIAFSLYRNFDRAGLIGAVHHAEAGIEIIAFHHLIRHHRADFRWAVYFEIRVAQTEAVGRGGGNR